MIDKDHFALHLPPVPLGAVTALDLGQAISEGVVPYLPHPPNLPYVGQKLLSAVLQSILPSGHLTLAVHLTCVGLFCIERCWAYDSVSKAIQIQIPNENDGIKSINSIKGWDFILLPVNFKTFTLLECPASPTPR